MARRTRSSSRRPLDARRASSAPSRSAGPSRSCRCRSSTSTSRSGVAAACCGAWRPACSRRLERELEQLWSANEQRQFDLRAAHARHDAQHAGGDARRAAAGRGAGRRAGRREPRPQRARRRASTGAHAERPYRAAAMEVRETTLPGALLLVPGGAPRRARLLPGDLASRRARGARASTDDFVQDNHSRSTRGVRARACTCRSATASRSSSAACAARSST